MKTKPLLMPICLSALIYLAGCATFQVAQDTQTGRTALQTGRANDAVVALMRAADTDPNYNTRYGFGEGVLTYLGRAYYETGRYPEARNVLEKRLANNKDDGLARLYLGLTLMRSGEPDRGRNEVESGLKGLQAELDHITSTGITGIFWDPIGMIRSDIRSALSGNLAAPDLVASAQRIGKQVDQEIDNARTDIARNNHGVGSGY